MLRNKIEKLSINGILLLNKLLGLTSNGALQKVKRLFNAKKAGHTGSLDPLATGMLPICFGEATKLSQYLLEANKYYQVEIKLGVRTATGDAEGAIIAEKPVNSAVQEIQQALLAFQGEIQQIPPMYSALKHQGKPLYELARQGIEIVRAARTINIYAIELISFTSPHLVLNVHCSKGTYIRTLADDLGEKLGCGAHVSILHRSGVAPYHQHTMHDLVDLETLQLQQGAAGLQQHLLPLETAVQQFPSIVLSSATAFYLASGQPVLVPKAPLNGLVRLLAENGKFLGLGEMLEDGRVAPRRLIKSTAPL